MPLLEANPANILTNIRDRSAFREWLERNHAAEAECWVEVKRGRPTDEGVFWYLDAVEEALASLIARTKRGEMYGEWNDYGRLLDY